jgi:hypothetical protein
LADDEEFRLQNDRLSEVDRLTLENQILQACVKRFAAMQSENPYVARMVKNCRESLRQFARRRRAFRPYSEIEQLSTRVVKQAERAGIQSPVVCLQRFSRVDWDAWVDEYEGLVGETNGNSPNDALAKLLEKTKAFAERRHDDG